MLSTDSAATASFSSPIVIRPAARLFVPYWKQATDGFDIFLADPSATSGIQIIRDKEPYYVDWIVVQK